MTPLGGLVTILFLSLGAGTQICLGIDIISSLSFATFLLSKEPLSQGGSLGADNAINNSLDSLYGIVHGAIPVYTLSAEK